MEGYKFATIVVTAANAPVAKLVSEAGMFTAALCKKGGGAVSHYCSTGYFAEGYVDALASAESLYAMAQESDAPVTMSQIEKLIDESDISDESPFSVFERLDLELYAEEV